MDGRFRPLKPLRELAETVATMLPAERRGEPHGRVLGFCRAPGLARWGKAPSD